LKVTQAEREIELNVPVETAYNQWTQVEDYPLFMEGVQEVRQFQQTDLVWTTSLDGRSRRWRAHVMRQIPDKVLAWKSEDGAGVSSTVLFEALGEDRSRVRIRATSEAETPDQLETRLGADLLRFKRLIEPRGMETGAWRGEILGGRIFPVAPLMDSVPAPPPDQIRFGVTPLQ
jgi:uncharacterized membrane protein